MGLENSLVSIIVRTKDRPKLLERALKSIADQTYRPVEVVLVNDGGCDLDLKRLQDILGDIVLQYIRLDENVGRSRAANIGIKRAQGEFIGFLDDDDEFYPDHISTLMDFLSHSDYRIAYTDSEIVKYDYDTEKEEFVVEDRYILFSEEFSFEKLLFGNYIPLMCLIFDAKVLTDLTFDEAFDLYEDWDMLIRIAEKFPFYHIEKVTAKYNQNLGQQITAHSRFQLNAFVQLMEKHIQKITPLILHHNWGRIVRWREMIKGLDEPLITIKRLTKLREQAEEEKDEIVELKNREIREIEEKLRIIKEERERTIAEKERTIAEKERTIAEKENIIAHMHKEILGLQTNISAMQNTLGWQILQFLRNLRDKILPAGSRRRYFFDLFIKSIKVLKTQGRQAFYYKVKWKLEGAKNIQIRKVKISDISIEGPVLNESTDIIVPVYNAFEDLQECIKSILYHTDINFHRLIVIDDKSPEQRIKNYLENMKVKLNNRNAIFFFNEENVGFARAANIGMKFSDRDVILLNSDTIVTRGWAEKLRKAAYTSPLIATVTPFSNNATICSIPNFCENNPLPELFTIDSFAEFIDRISLRYYPQIPTGVGFCMYIKRKVLNETGFFDESCFDKGYGEENDFCVRSLKKGYKHVLDDATFIYHKGGSSFTQSVKAEKEQEALKILNKLHPVYLPIVNRFILENPLRDIHDYIKLRLEIERKKRNLTQNLQSIER
jgi:GT2 family glycosyltransferase